MPDSSQADANRELDATSIDENATAWPLHETAIGTVLCVGTAAMGFAPRLLPVILSLLSVLTAAEVVRAGKPFTQTLQEAFAPLAMKLSIAFLGLAGLSALWAAEPRLALQSTVQVGSLILATGLLVTLLPAYVSTLPPIRRRRFVRAAVLGFLAALVFLIVEVVAGNPFSFAALRAFPALAGDSAKGIVREGGRIVSFEPFYLDRNVAAMTLLVPAGVVALLAWLPRAVSRPFAIGAVVVAGVIAAISTSGAATLAAVSGLIVALAGWRWPLQTSRSLMAVVTVGVVLAVPLGHLPSKLGMETAPWVSPSARERAMIWDRTASAVLRNPLLGIGVQSTRFQEADRKEVVGLSGARRQLGWHAHNFVLQTWLELGAAGALLLLAFALAMLRTIEALAPSHRPAAFSLFAMVLAIGVTGWGLWQPWLIAVFGTAMMALVVTPASGRARA